MKLACGSRHSELATKPHLKDFQVLFDVGIRYLEETFSRTLANSTRLLSVPPSTPRELVRSLTIRVVSKTEVSSMM